MHFIVVQFYIAGQVGASALVNADFFPQLRSLHLQLPIPILHLDQLRLFFFDESVR